MRIRTLALWKALGYIIDLGGIFEEFVIPHDASNSVLKTTLAAEDFMVVIRGHKVIRSRVSFVISRSIYPRLRSTSPLISHSCSLELLQYEVLLILNEKVLEHKNVYFVQRLMYIYNYIWWPETSRITLPNCLRTSSFSTS